MRPLAGTLTYLLCTVGIIGVGFLAIPTLAGSAAYAFAETFSWKQGLDKSLRGARYFYWVLVTSILLGLALDFFKMNPVKALFWTAVINGVLAPFCSQNEQTRLSLRPAVFDEAKPGGLPEKWF